MEWVYSYNPGARTGQTQTEIKTSIDICAERCRHVHKRTTSLC